MRTLSAEHLASYITGDIPGRLGSLERDGIQPEVIATGPVLLPGVSVDFLVERTEVLVNKEQPLPACYLVSAGIMFQGCLRSWLLMMLGDVPTLGIMELTVKDFCPSGVVVHESSSLAVSRHSQGPCTILPVSTSPL